MDKQKHMRLDLGLKSQFTKATHVDDIRPDMLWNYIFEDPTDSKNATLTIKYSDGGVLSVQSGSGKKIYSVTVPFRKPPSIASEYEDEEMADLSDKKVLRKPNASVHIIDEKTVLDIIKQEKDNQDLVDSLRELISFIKENKTVIKWNDAEVFIKYSPNCIWRIRSGLGKNEIEITNNRGNIDISLAPDNTKYDEAEKVDEINKRVLGKALVKLCGNEGSCKNPSLRKLFQAAIDGIGTYDGSDVLRNAKMTFYDEHNNVYQFKSGNGKYLFIINDEGGKPKIVFPKNVHESNPCNVM